MYVITYKEKDSDKVKSVLASRYKGDKGFDAISKRDELIQDGHTFISIYKNYFGGRQCR